MKLYKGLGVMLVAVMALTSLTACGGEEVKVQVEQESSQTTSTEEEIKLEKQGDVQVAEVENFHFEFPASWERATSSGLLTFYLNEGDKTEFVDLQYASLPTMGYNLEKVKADPAAFIKTIEDGLLSQENSAQYYERKGESKQLEIHGNPAWVMPVSLHWKNMDSPARIFISLKEENMAILVLIVAPGNESKLDELEPTLIEILKKS